MLSVNDKTTTTAAIASTTSKTKIGFSSMVRALLDLDRADLNTDWACAQLIVPHKVVESYHGERQNEGNECAQPDLRADACICQGGDCDNSNCFPSRQRSGRQSCSARWQS